MPDISIFKKQLLNTLIFVSDGESSLLKEIQALTSREAWFVALFVNDNLANNSFAEKDKEKLYQAFRSILALLEDIRNIRVLEFSENALRQAIKSEADLAVPANKERILATCYRLLGSSDNGLCCTLADALEKIDDKKMFFSSLNESDRLLYINAYIVAVSTGFGGQKLSTQRGFLANNFFVLALRMGFDLVDSIANFIRSNLTVIARRSLSLDFAACLSVNKGRVGIDKDSQQTVADLLNRAKTYLGESIDIEKLNEFYLKDEIFLSNPDFEKDLMRRIVDLYFSLISGEYIFEDEAIKKTIEKMRADKKNKVVEVAEASKFVTFDESLSKHVDDFVIWIKERENLVKMYLWLNTYKNNELAQRELVKLFSRVFSLEFLGDQDNVAAIIELDDMLKKNGYGKKDSDIVSFHESDDKFHWADEGLG